MEKSEKAPRHLDFLRRLNAAHFISLPGIHACKGGSPAMKTRHFKGLMYLGLALVLGLFAIALLRKSGALALSTALYGGLLQYLWLSRPSSPLLAPKSAPSSQWRERWLPVVAAALVILLISPLMNLSPRWSGREYREDTTYLKQYEQMAKSLSEGKLYLDYGDGTEEALAALDNPYDWDQRGAAGIYLHWDTAYYEGHLYMYYGVVPAVLLFLPYLLLTGQSLPTMVATMIFTAGVIAGLFYLFALLRRRFFPKVRLMVSLSLGVALSILSVYYFAEFPILYCTASSSAVCFELWSLILFFRAVWVEPTEGKQIRSAFFGALLGALTFGCRPTTALANVLVIPMLITWLKHHPLTLKRAGKLLLAALPYAVVAVLLMLYNAARFGNPLEFGQCYQLTLADQRTYSDLITRLDPAALWAALGEAFFLLPPVSGEFPWLTDFGGLLILFPILWEALLILHPRAWASLKEKGARGVALLLLIVPVVIIVFQRMYSPCLIERYKWDYLFLLCIAVYLGVCLLIQTGGGGKRHGFATLQGWLCALTLISAFLCFIVPYDFSFTGCNLKALEPIRQVILWEYSPIQNALGKIKNLFGIV